MELEAINSTLKKPYKDDVTEATAVKKLESQYEPYSQTNFDVKVSQNPDHKLSSSKIVYQTKATPKNQE